MRELKQIEINDQAKNKKRVPSFWWNIKKKRKLTRRKRTRRQRV